MGKDVIHIHRVRVTSVSSPVVIITLGCMAELGKRMFMLHMPAHQCQQQVCGNNIVQHI